MQVSAEEMAHYKKGTKPKRNATQDEIGLCKSQLHSLVKKTEEDFNSGVFIKYKKYTLTTKTKLSSAKEAIQFNHFHEGVHLGYVGALKRALGI
jgi:hypothetical protein